MTIITNCRFRYGIAKKRNVFFVCGYAGEKYPLNEIYEICSEFCPFTNRKNE